MLDLETILNTLKKYGYTSVNTHPFVYKTDTSIGICYAFVDGQFGTLERIKICKTAEDADDFLKRIEWFRVNGKINKVSMKLDDYDSPTPNVLYSRKGHIMASDEMFNLEKYDNLEYQQSAYNEIEKYLVEASKLVEYYNARKEDQINFAFQINEELKEHKKVYYELQLEIDKYNKTSHNRKLGNVEIIESGTIINMNAERSIKERLSQYRSNPPEIEEAKQFIHDVWDLCNVIDANKIYYDNKLYELRIINDTKHGRKKLEYMRSLKEKKNVFVKDLTAAFKKIDKQMAENDLKEKEDYVAKKIEKANKKYSYWDRINCLRAFDYLTETLINTNFEEVAVKYSSSTEFSIEEVVLDYEEIIANLGSNFVSLSVADQNALILYYSDYNRLFNMIMNVNAYDTISKPALTNELKKNSDFKEIKELLYDNVKIAIEQPFNDPYKRSVFANYDFTSFESFLGSCVNTINTLKNSKDVRLVSDVSAYFVTDDYANISRCPIVDTSKDIKVYSNLLGDNQKIVYGTIHKDISILYAPRIIDFGDKSSNATYSIKLNDKNNISFINSDLINVNQENPIILANYASNVVLEGDIHIVDKLLLNDKNEIYLTDISNKGVNLGGAINQQQSSPTEVKV